MKPCGHDTEVEKCRYCFLFRMDERYHRLWAAKAEAKALVSFGPCAHLGLQVIRAEKCSTCRGNVAIKVFPCSEFGECTLGVPMEGVKGCCAGGKCPKYEARPSK